MTFRFIIGNNEIQSDSWRLFTNGNEIYLLKRNILSNVVKFSFHNSKNCRWALIDSNKNGRERVISEWQRDETPHILSEQASLLLRMAFPTNHLSKTTNSAEKKSVYWITPAPTGCAVGIEIFLSHQTSQEISTTFKIFDQRSLLYSNQLRDGSYVHLATHNFDCGPVNLTLASSDISGARFNNRVYFPNIDENHSNRPFRMTIFRDNESPPTVWELGGFDNL